MILHIFFWNVLMWIEKREIFHIYSTFWKKIPTFCCPYYFSDPHILLGSTPNELPYDVALLVGSERVAIVKHIFHLAVVHIVPLYDAHQLPVFEEVVEIIPVSCLGALLQSTTFFKETFRPVDLFKNAMPSSWPINVFKNKKICFILYEPGKNIGRAFAPALLESLPIIWWQSLAIVKCLNR